jgi:hypothetical protein
LIGADQGRAALDCQRGQPGIVDVVPNQTEVGDESAEDSTVAVSGGDAAGSGISPQVVFPEAEGFLHRDQLQTGQGWNPQQSRLDQFAKADGIARRGGFC